MTKNIGVDAAKLAGLQIDGLRKLRSGQLTIEQMEWWQNQTWEERQQFMSDINEVHNNNQILHRLYENEEIIVGATTGQETIANASDLFTGYLDSDFKNWGTNKPSGVSTEVTPAKVYELHQNANLREMFSPLGKIDDLCWEQGQIINFCREHRDKLHPEGWAAFFLFKTEDHIEHFVVSVGSGCGGLEVFVHRFGYGHVWFAAHRYRLVVPQLDA